MSAVGSVLAREEELDAIDGFLTDPGSAWALLLRGEPGIGKSTLWLACIGLASERGYQIVSTRPTEAEAKFSYMGLGDLLEGLTGEVLDDLPGPQRVALNATLLRADAPSEALDHRTICVAVLAALRTIAASAPLLIAIDDVQWLDGPTALVLEFVARRLKDEPIRFITALRTAAGVSDPVDLARTLGEGQVRTIDLKGLSPDSLNALFQERLDTSFARPTLNRILEASEGNPFVALEIARAIAAGRLQLEPGRLPSIPSDLADLIPPRLADLPTSAQELLVMCAAASAPTTRLLRSAVDDPERVTTELAAAVSAGVIDLEGERIRFTHPLLSSAVYSETTEDHRRETHRRLAAVIVDPEEHARHVALATDGPDPDVAAELEEAARLARQRGAPGAAADLCVLAADRTPTENTSDAWRLRLRAADDLLIAGDMVRAQQMARSVIETAPPGPERAEALLRKAQASTYGHLAGPVQELSDALLQPGVRLERLSTIHRELAWALRQHDLRAAKGHAEKAVHLAEHVGDPTLVAAALHSLVALQTMLGSIVPEDLLAQAVQRDEVADHFFVFDRPRVILGIRGALSGKLDESRDLFLRLLDEATSKGDEASTADILGRLGWIERLTGNWEMSLAYHARAVTLLPSPDPVLDLVCLQAHMGDVTHAAAEAWRALHSSQQAYDLEWSIEARSVLGFIDLSNGDPVGAHEHLQTAWEIQQRWGFGEPGPLFPFVHDHVEVLIELGRRDDAVRVLEWLEERGRALDRPWALAVAARYRGLLAAARGDPPAAVDFLDDALMHHERLPMPFELGRTLLVQGTIRRRAKQKRPAREALEHALEIFERLGAPLWASKARAELARVSGRRPVVGQLTPAERRVARLAAAGRTNQEIADALFTSTRTVGAHLSHIYSKLGIRSRTELALFPEPAEDPLSHS